jgi:hypothetical protein
MKHIILACILLGFLFPAVAQMAGNRVNLKYKISKKKIKELRDRNFLIKSRSQPIKKYFEIGDFESGYFKCIINFKDGILNIDPYAIIDSRTTPGKNFTDPFWDSCAVINGDTACIINANTKNDLQIDLNRTKVGNPTRAIILPYETLIIGINNISIKFRPKVRDYNDSLFTPNVVGSNINLGLTFGYSFGWTKFSHRSDPSVSITPAFSLGFSAISLSKEPLKRKVSVITQPGNFTLSPAASVILARNDVGLIFAYGTDIMFGKNASAWAYQKKGWFGIGIAAGLKL